MPGSHPSVKTDLNRAIKSAAGVLYLPNTPRNIERGRWMKGRDMIEPEFDDEQIRIELKRLVEQARSDAHASMREAENQLEAAIEQADESATKEALMAGRQTLAERDQWLDLQINKMIDFIDRQ